MLFTVYDPKGEMFEVSPSTARECIITHGWTPNPPAVNADLPLFSAVDRAATAVKKPKGAR